MKKLITGISIILSISSLAASNEVKSDFNLLEIKHGEAKQVEAKKEEKKQAGISEYRSEFFAK